MTASYLQWIFESRSSTLEAPIEAQRVMNDDVMLSSADRKRKLSVGNLQQLCDRPSKYELVDDVEPEQREADGSADEPESDNSSISLACASSTLLDHS